MMRRALERKLRDPEWRARQQRRYGQIVAGETGTRIPIANELSLRELDALGALDDSTVDEEEGAIEALWLGRWQRSADAYTITRMPDNSVRLDNPDGTRQVFRICDGTVDGFSWMAEEVAGSGVTIATRHFAIDYGTEEAAFLAMHKAALAEFEAATNLY